MLQHVVVVETVFFTPGSFVHVCLRVYEGIYLQSRSTKRYPPPTPTGWWR